MAVKKCSCILALAVLIQAARSQKCPQYIQRERERCESLLVPNPRHPVYAPIIGGADADFARDMCSSQSWLQGMTCMKNLEENCAGDAKLSGMIRNCYNADNVRRGAENFCSNLNVYTYYAECYFDLREGLQDCYQQFTFEVVRLYARGDRSTLDSLIQGYCKATNYRINCQNTVIRGPCGAQAADVVLKATRMMRAPKCSHAPVAYMHPLVVLLMAILAKILS